MITESESEHQIRARASALRKMGLPHRLETDRNFPFVVAAPLCREGEIWTDAEALRQLLDGLAREHRVDDKRVYVVGHSMGGRGALYTAFKNPERFAAVVAMSPISPITAWATRLKDIPLWLVHGANDKAAPAADSDELAAAIEKAGGRARYTRLEDRDHFILDLFDKNEVFDWLLEHAR